MENAVEKRGFEGKSGGFGDLRRINRNSQAFTANYTSIRRWR